MDKGNKSDGIPRIRNAYGKSKFSCTTCRKRHVRCDESRPGCKRCARIGRACIYPLTYALPQRPKKTVPDRVAPVEGRCQDTAFAWSSRSASPLAPLQAETFTPLNPLIYRPSNLKNLDALRQISQHVPLDTSSLSGTGWSKDDADLEVSVLATPPSCLAVESSFRPRVSRRHEDGTKLDSTTSLLGAGRVDPFRPPSVYIGSGVNELLDHSIRVFWPGFRPESKLTSAWLEKFYTSPIVMHALLFGAAVNVNALRGPQFCNNKPSQLYHKVQTIRLVNEELKSGRKTALDEVILAVLTLGSNEVETIANTRENTRSPFNSPLSSAQWLNVFGSISEIPLHTSAMNTLVARRGGLENIQINGLAEVLSFADILHATQRLSKPHFPLLDRSLRLIGGLPNFVVRRLGQGFQDLLGLGINEGAATVFQTMADLSTIINAHCCGAKPISNMTLFIDHRNAVQHSLMSLRRGDELDYGEISSVCLYESVRHAAIIYGAAVIFPLPSQTGIFHSLATRLQSILEESQVDPFWQLCPEALLWVLVLGGIASTDNACRNWYVQNLAVVSAALMLSDWEGVAEKLGNYLWLESACDAGGRLLWIDVLNETPWQELGTQSLITS
ncbi:hypothetical protein CI102_14752 [Trichoderma harzianum]|nr:hypothetical protein CI102_14752 [Trichoderma harzianum]